MQRKHLAVAVLSATAALGLGGAGIATAQSDDGTSPNVATPGTSTDATTPVDATTEAPDGCVGGGGRGAGPVGTAPDAEGSTTAETPADGAPSA